MAPPSLAITAAAAAGSTFVSIIVSWGLIVGVLYNHIATPHAEIPTPAVVNATCDVHSQYQGDWDENTTYPPTSIVFHNGSSYIALCGGNNNEGIEPGTNSSVWQVIAQGGSDGDDGSDGSDGINGTTALTWRGEWQANVTDYVAFDLVYYEGSSYIAVDDDITPGEPPVDDFLHWNILALKGQSLIFIGEWNASHAFVPYDVVTYEGSVYINILANTGDDPTDDTVWALLASKGDSGLGLTHRGEWSALTAYAVNDIVSQSGSSYVCTVAHTNLPPSSNPSHWGINAAKGTTGATGQGFAWQGDWDDATAYVAYDVVSHDGNIYVCTASNMNQEPPNMLYWDLAASQGDTGGTGATGQGFNWLGSWDSGTAYVPYDVVTSGGSMYICTASNTNEEPPNGLYWDVTASKGDAGADGQGFNWLGSWSGATAYVAYDVVSSGGNIYVCTASNTNQMPPNVLYWNLGASKGDTGATGSTGQGFNWLGEWDSGTAYVAYDVVSNDGSIYVCTASNTNQEPPNVLYWELGALKGDKGNGYGGTSTSTAELTDDYLDKIFVLSSPGYYAYNAASRVRCTCGDPINYEYMEGLVMSYDASTYTLIMQPDYASVYLASCSSWNISLIGEFSYTPGPTGPPGPTLIQSWIITDQKTKGTNGGTASAGRQKRTLNTLYSGVGSTGCSISSNEFTLTSGTYDIYAWSLAHSASAYTTHLEIVLASNGGTYCYGDSTNGLAGEATKPAINCQVTAGNPSTTFALFFEMSVVGGATDFGKPANLGSSPEVYTFMKIQKAAA